MAQTIRRLAFGVLAAIVAVIGVMAPAAHAASVVLPTFKYDIPSTGTYGQGIALRAETQGGSGPRAYTVNITIDGAIVATETGAEGQYPVVATTVWNPPTDNTMYVARAELVDQFGVTIESGVQNILVGSLVVHPSLVPNIPSTGTVGVPLTVAASAVGGTDGPTYAVAIEVVDAGGVADYQSGTSRPITASVTFTPTTPDIYRVLYVLVDAANNEIARGSRFISVGGVNPGPNPGPTPAPEVKNELPQPIHYMIPATDGVCPTAWSLSDGNCVLTSEYDAVTGKWSHGNYSEVMASVDVWRAAQAEQPSTNPEGDRSVMTVKFRTNGAVIDGDASALAGKDAVVTIVVKDVNKVSKADIAAAQEIAKKYDATYGGVVEGNGWASARIVAAYYL